MSELAQTPKSLPLYARDADRPYEGDPWSRQPQETARSYDGFKMFLDLGDGRTLAEASRSYAAKYGTNPAGNKFSQWNRQHRWTERAQAYDNFIASQEIAAHKRARVKAATRHAKQAAEVQEVLMLPMMKLRERLKDALNGDDTALTMFDTMDDAELAKVARAFSQDVPGWQKSEREALSSTSDVAPPSAGTLKAKGEIVRKILANPTMRGLMERATFEVEVPLDGSLPIGDERSTE